MAERPTPEQAAVRAPFDKPDRAKLECVLFGDDYHEPAIPREQELEPGMPSKMSVANKAAFKMLGIKQLR